MKPLSFDKSSIPLIAMLGIMLAAVVYLFVALRSNAVDEAIKTDRILNVAVILEKDAKPVSTQVFMFYPSNGRGAILDVPAETGLIIKSLNRVDRISVLYNRSNPRAYVAEVADLLQTSIPYWVVINEEDLIRSVDLMEGIEVFVPEKVELPGPPSASLPSGALILDGDKAAQFAFYKDPDDSDSDLVARRQKLFQSVIRRIGEKSAWISRPDVFQALKQKLKSNMDSEGLRRFALQLGKIDADRLILQRVTGIFRDVDGNHLLFPHYDGELVRDIVKQTLNGLSNSATSSPADKIFSIEILNGTPTKGLGKKAAEIFQSFGYDVISVDNADREDYDLTQVIDRYSNGDATKAIAAVIRCRQTKQQSGGKDPSEADFTIIVGKDFNGRYCTQ